jgi:hypothetical protein
MNITSSLRTVIQALGVFLAMDTTTPIARGSDLMYGCAARPACGKVCKLVCETTTLQAVGYGYKCESICIPSPGRRGCKHCETTCCAGDELAGCRPKIEFCWYDWFACGCAKPRTVKVLTKYQAERKIESYRWEVIDVASCCDDVLQADRSASQPDIYKPAPPDAQLGDMLAVSEQEWNELGPVLSPAESVVTTPLSPPTPDVSSGTIKIGSEHISIAERLRGLLGR